MSENEEPNAGLPTWQDGVNGDAASLLAFYRSRFDEIEKERHDWVQRVAQAEVSHAEVHRARWELRVRQEEVSELQNALSDANVQLFEEREESLKLLAENEKLKMLQAEDRRRIQHLLALTEPVTQTVTFFKDCRPYLMTRKHHGKKQAQLDVDASEKADSNQVRVVPNENMRSSTNELAASGSVMRTVYLPNEQTEALTKRVEALESQLAEHSRLSKDRITALEKDRVEREALHKRESTELREQVKALEQKLEAAEASARKATRDYLDLRLEAQTKERSTMERSSALCQENTQLRRELDTLSDRLKRETEAIRSSVIEDGEAYVQRFRRQAIMAQDKLNKLKQSKQGELDAAREQVRDLAAKLQEANKKCHALEQRRRFDFEGFNKDVGELRKQLRSLESVALGAPRTSAARPETKARAQALHDEIEFLRRSIEELDPDLAPAPAPAPRRKQKSRRRPLQGRAAWVD